MLGGAVPLIFVGGAGIPGRKAEAPLMAKAAEALGVPREAMAWEASSRNTYENALAVKEILGGEPFVLVTSAFHMPRAVGVFRKAGFPVTPWPVDYKTAGNEKPGFAEDNALDSLRNVTVGIREWIGLAAYRIAGRTDAFLPAPEASLD